MGAKYVWEGDPAIGLTYESWCYEVACRRHRVACGGPHR